VTIGYHPTCRPAGALQLAHSTAELLRRCAMATSSSHARWSHAHRPPLALCRESRMKCTGAGGWERLHRPGFTSKKPAPISASATAGRPIRLVKVAIQAPATASADAPARSLLSIPTPYHTVPYHTPPLSSCGVCTGSLTT
jgi:hypothetical protein